MQAESQASSHYAVNVDSLVTARLDAQLLRAWESTGEETLELLIFDTGKPTDSLSGTPPLKAALRGQKRQSARGGTATTRTERTERQSQTAARSDTMLEQTLAEVVVTPERKGALGKVRTSLVALAVVSVCFLAAYIMRKTNILNILKK